MVGVPGRSKACITCRKRNKSCDSRKPGCSQCKRLGFVCEGYVRPLIFINKTVANSAPTISSLHKAVTTSITLPQSLAQSARDDRYVGLFWEAYFPNGRTRPTTPIAESLGIWMEAIQDFHLTDNVLRKAVLAIALGTVGKHDDQRWMREESSRIYATALQDMHRALRAPANAKSDGLYSASKLFSLYEAIHGNGNKELRVQANTWLVHASGEQALMTTRRPEEYTRGRAHRLFVSGRLPLIVTALKARRRSILSYAEWREVPWRHHLKSPRDLLLDILVDMPAVLEAVDVMKACSDPGLKSVQRLKLLGRCTVFDQQLSHWYGSHWPCKDPKEEETRTKSEETSVLDLEDLSSAHMKTLYWATCIILYTAMPLVKSLEESIPEHADPRIYVRHIARSVPIFLHPAVGISRVHLATFPMGVALKCLLELNEDEMPEERRLLVSYFKKPEGTTMGAFLNSMEGKPSKVFP